MANCPLSPITYADTTSGSCLSICSSPYYGYTPGRTCHTTCPNSLLADPLTRLCVGVCDVDLGNLFGDWNLAVPACVAICSSGSYADPLTQTCVGACPITPVHTYMFDNGDTGSPIRECVESCPYPYVADANTNKCLLQCTDPTKPYLNRLTQTCVASCSASSLYGYLPLGQSTEGECVSICPTVGAVVFFSLPTNSSCVTRCPLSYYGTVVKNTCTTTCSGQLPLSGPLLNLYVAICLHSTTYFSYAD